LKSFLRTRSIRIVAALAVASGTAGLASLTALSATPSAQADPLAATARVGVGADVTQDVFDALSGAAAPGTATTNFYTPLHTGGGLDNVTIQSFDAFPTGGSTLNPGCITTKTGGPSFDRPNSTTAGIAALNAEIDGDGFENTSASCTNSVVNVTGQFDFARAARGPKTGGSVLTFAPFARDAVGYLYFNNGGTAPSALTRAQLATAYSAGGTSTIAGTTIYPCLTITGSAPRSNLETAIGVSDTTAEAAAKSAGCDQIQQNSGNAFYAFAKTIPSGSAAIIPISSGDWIGQANGVSVDESNTARNNGVAIGSVTDGSSALGSPASGTAPNLTPNTTYYQDSNFGYNIYTVLPTNTLSGLGADSALVSLFTNTLTSPSNNAVICQSAIQTEIHTFGFDSLTSGEGSCGSTTTQGDS
jgi:hypothetical protein